MTPEAKQTLDAIGNQNREFDAVAELAKRYSDITTTAIVDDDYPEVRHRYEGALHDLMRALALNQRFAPGTRGALAILPAMPLTRTVGLSFATLREANIARLPLFKNAQGGPAHSQADGSDWTVSDWFVAVLGELGEAANQHKKMKRHDFPASEWESEHKKLAHELADVAIYLDILAFRIGVDLGAIIAEKWNKTSEKIGLPLRIDNGTDTFFRDVSEGI